MPSPFPGMNPYLEQEAVWHDFHERFCPAAAEALTMQIRPHFIAKIDQHVYIHERLSFLEIRDRQTWRVVTVIELLSPSNKQPGPDREQYVAKRSELLRNAINFVELDLLRGGPRMPMEDLPECDYYTLVGPVDERPGAGVWPIQLHDPLPVIPIPLLPPYAPARLDLKQILDRIYEGAGYEDYIYGGEPRPPLAADAAAWARQWIPEP